MAYILIFLFNILPRLFSIIASSPSSDSNDTTNILRKERDRTLTNINTNY